VGLVKELSPELEGNQRRFLRSKGHELDPVVLVGQRGVNENLVGNFEDALEAHELVKVKVHNKDAIPRVAESLHESTDAQLAQQIGNMLLFYRENSEDPNIQLPQGD
jgi:RNA-binding protein